MVDVPIDDCDALGAVRRLRVAGRDGGVVEEAEAHRLRALGMVAGRPHGAEGVGGLPGHHPVDRRHGGADAAQHRLVGARRHHGVGVDLHEALARSGVRDGAHVRLGMGEQQAGGVRLRRLHPPQRRKTLLRDRLLDRADAVGPFRMAGGRLVLENGGVMQVQGCHASTSGPCRALSRISRSALSTADAAAMPQAVKPAPSSTSTISGGTPKRTGRMLVPSPPDTIRCRPSSTTCP